MPKEPSQKKPPSNLSFRRKPSKKKLKQVIEEQKSTFVNEGAQPDWDNIPIEAPEQQSDKINDTQAPFHVFEERKSNLVSEGAQPDWDNIPIETPEQKLDEIDDTQDSLQSIPTNDSEVGAKSGFKRSRGEPLE